MFATKAASLSLRAAGVGVHSGLITVLTSLLSLGQGPAGWPAAPLRQGLPVPHSTPGSLQGRHSAAAAAPPPLASGSPRRYATGTDSTKPEEFELLTVDTGLARVDGYDERGFVVSGVQVEGAVLAFGGLFALWRVRRLEDITPESLAILDLLRPVPDLLVLGCGDRVGRVPEGVAAHLRQRGVALEALDTANAASTFNILNQEGRKCVGALLPLGE